MVTTARSENQEIVGLSSFPKMKPTSYYSKMKQNNSMELLGYSMNHIYYKNIPRPHIRILQDFPDFR